VHRAAALVVAAAFFFILANAFPFLILRANYRESYMHLSGCISGLQQTLLRHIPAGRLILG
jgi:hypothetical protein